MRSNTNFYSTATEVVSGIDFALVAKLVAIFAPIAVIGESVLVLLR